MIYLAPLAAGLVLMASVAAAEAPKLAGDVISPQSTEDVQELIRIADAVDAGVDAKDWDLVRALFTDEITVDFTSLVGGEPATIQADALIDGWSANLKPSKTSFHLRGNHRVTFVGEDRAVMLSHGYAWNRMEAGALPENGGDPLWEVWGTYEHGFERSDDGWRVNAMTFTVTAERGNAFVRDTVPES